MLADISLEKSIEIFKTKGGTSIKQVIAALRELGISCGDKLISLKQKPKTPICIVKLHFKGFTNTHWVVIAVSIITIR